MLQKHGDVVAQAEHNKWRAELVSWRTELQYYQDCLTQQSGHLSEMQEAVDAQLKLVEQSKL